MKFNFTPTVGSDAVLSYLVVLVAGRLVLFTDLRITTCHGSLFCNSDGGLFISGLWIHIGLSWSLNNIDNVKAKIQGNGGLGPTCHYGPFWRTGSWQAMANGSGSLHSRFHASCWPSSGASEFMGEGRVGI